MIISRLVETGSKRFTASRWQQTTLPALLHIPNTLSVNALYEVMDTLLAQQSRIESRLRTRYGFGRLVMAGNRETSKNCMNADRSSLSSTAQDSLVYDRPIGQAKE